MPWPAFPLTNKVFYAVQPAEEPKPQVHASIYRKAHLHQPTLNWHLQGGESLSETSCLEGTCTVG